MDYASARKRVVLRRLSFPGLFPVADIPWTADGGTLSLSASASVKAQASWTHKGGGISSGDVVRLSCEFDDGREREEVPLATLKCYYGETGERGGLSSCDVEAYGLAKIAADARYWQPYSVRAGTEALDAVADVLGSVGLTLAYRPDESHPVRTSKTYFPEDFSKLDIANDLLSGAGYLSADTDELGRVVLRRSAPTPSWAPVELAPGPRSTIEDESAVERDWAGICNVVIGVVDGPDETMMRAVAVNDSPADPTSTVARGEVCRVERLNDIESQDVLQAKVAALLSEERSRLEAVRVRCAFAPLRLFGPVAVRKGSADGVYTVQSMEIDLRTMAMDVRARRYL